MTVSAQTPRINYTADGVEDTFTYNFLILDQSHIKVYEDGVLTIRSYTVTGVGSGSGGDVIFTGTVPLNGVIVTLQREMNYEQLADYTAYGETPVDVHEVSLDKLCMMIQQLNDAVENRSIKIPIQYDLSNLEVTPAPHLPIGFNAAGDGLTTLAGMGSIAVSAYWKNILEQITASTSLEETGWLDQVNAWDAQQYQSKTTLSISASAISINMNTNPYCEVTLTENITINDLTNKAAGKIVILKVKQDATGGRTLTWNSNLDCRGSDKYPDSNANAITLYKLFAVDSTTVLVTKIWQTNYDQVPAGTIIMCPALDYNDTIPDGWLECDGSSISQTTYDKLYNGSPFAIGGKYGSGGGNFNLPDYRGRFVRGVDGTAGVDPDKGSRTDRGDGTTGNAVGTKQADQFKSHRHDIYSATTPATAYIPGAAYQNYAYKYTGYSGGNETRPRNIYVTFLIKY